jgi:GNAT superfamily N-acetyltransferase
MPDSIRRFFSYLSRHGIRATAGRIALSWRRFRAGNRFVIYSCNVQEAPPVDDGSLKGGKVERRNAQAEIPPDELDLLTGNWAPAIVRRRMAARFDRGASLWEFKVGEKLAGYGWSLAGGSMESHFFPLQPDDVHLFDFYVFPEFRGRGINPLLVNYILSRLKLENKDRAFIEAAEWNVAQLSSLGRTPFQLVGKASIRRRPGKTVVTWSSPE